MIKALLRPNRLPMPDDLTEIVTHDAEAEVAPESVGLRQRDVDQIWRSIEQVYETGLHSAISVSLRRQGQVVLRRSIGHARLGRPGEPGPARLCTPDTPICLFSASKAVTAMLVHKLSEQRKLGLDDLVTRYIPEYGAEGKGNTTIRHLLAHRAGIPRVEPGTDPDLLFDWDSVIQLLCSAKPISTDGEIQSYHAITAGFILGEIVQRVSGQSLRDFMREQIAEPMGLKHFTYGLPREHRHEAATNYFIGPNSWFPISLYFKHILSTSFEHVVEVSNSPGFLSSVVPAGNLYATADEIGMFFQMMLQRGRWNGREIFKPETIEEAIRPAGPIHIDRTLLLPVRFSAGMVLGEWPLGIYGLNCRSAFGHLGFVTTLAWADPARDIAVAIVKSGKSVSLEQFWPMAKVLGAISRGCPANARTRRAVN